LILTFGERDKVWIGDLNGDKRLDLAVSRIIPGQGTGIDTFIQTGTGFVAQASAFIQFGLVQSIGAFDVTEDGIPELVVLVEGKNNLAIYQGKDAEWAYVKEMVLPVNGGVLFRSGLETAFLIPYLYILDRNLTGLASIMPTQPNAFRIGLRFPSDFVRTLDVKLTGETDPIVAIEMDDSLILIEKQHATISPFLVVETGSEVPFLIIGDYLGDGTRQVVWVP
jgi:hypothetical protein